MRNRWCLNWMTLFCLLTAHCRRPIGDASAKSVIVAPGQSLEVTSASHVVAGDLEVQGTLRIIQGEGPSETVVQGNMTLAGTADILRASASAGRQALSLNASPHTFVVGGVFRLVASGAIVTPDGLNAPSERYVLPSVLPVAFTGQTGGHGGDIRIEAREIVIEACNGVAPRLSLGNGGRGADVTIDDSAARTLGGQGHFDVTSGSGGESGQLILVSDTISFPTCAEDDAVTLERAEGGDAGALRWFVRDDQHWTIPEGRSLALAGGRGGDGMRSSGAGGSVEYVSGKSVSDRDGPGVGAGAGDGGSIIWRPDVAWEIPKFKAQGAHLGPGGSVLQALGNDGASALPSGVFVSGGAGGRMAVMVGSPGSLRYSLATSEALVGEPGSIRGPVQAGRGGEGLDLCETAQQGGIGGNGGRLVLMTSEAPVTLDASFVTLAVGGKGGDGTPGSVGGESGDLFLSRGVSLRGEPLALPPASDGAPCLDVPPVPEEDPWHDTTGLPPPLAGSQFVFFDGSKTAHYEGPSGISMISQLSTTITEDHITSTRPEQTIGRRSIVHRGESVLRDETGAVVQSTASLHENTFSCDYVNNVYVHNWRHTDTDRLKNETTVTSGTSASGLCDLPTAAWGGYSLHQCYATDSGWVYVGSNHSSVITKAGSTVSLTTRFSPLGTPQTCTCRTYIDVNGQERAVPDCQ